MRLSASDALSILLLGATAAAAASNPSSPELWIDLGNSTFAAIDPADGKSLWVAAGDFLLAHGDLVFAIAANAAGRSPGTPPRTPPHLRSTETHGTAGRTQGVTSSNTPPSQRNTTTGPFTNSTYSATAFSAAAFKPLDSSAGPAVMVALHADTGREQWRAELPSKPFNFVPYSRDRAFAAFGWSMAVVDISPQGGCASASGGAAGAGSTRVCQTWALNTSSLVLATVPRPGDGLRVLWVNHTADDCRFFNLPEGTFASAPYYAAVSTVLAGTVPSSRFYGLNPEGGGLELTLTAMDPSLSSVASVTISENVPMASSSGDVNFGGSQAVMYLYLWVQSVNTYTLAAVNTSTFAVIWQRHDLPNAGSFTINQSLRDGILVGANNTKGTVSLLDATTGRAMWTRPLMAELTATMLRPLRGGGFTSTTSDGNVTCYSGAGVKLWRRKLPNAGYVWSCRAPLGLSFGGYQAARLDQPCLL